MRIGLIAFLHESNTFSADQTTLENFRQDVLVSGEDVLRRFEGSHHEMGGFIDGLKQLNATPVGVYAARALPSGIITAATFDEILKQILAQLDQAGPLDGILVAPHGATVAENFHDGDGAWLTALRCAIGEKMPIFGTLDPHANLSPAMVAATNALLAYQTNPHIDQFDRGRQAAHLLARTIQGEIAPMQAAAFSPLAICIERQCSQESPAREFLAEMEVARRECRLLDASFFYGFPYADVAEMGAAILCIADGNQTLAQESADHLSAVLWDRREETLGYYCDIESAIERAQQLAGPVCLLDMGDNIGAGSAADGTWIAHSLLGRKVDRCFVALCDSEAAKTVSSAAVGSKLMLSIGGKRSEFDGQPLVVDVEVVSCHAGRFVESQPRHGGKTEFDMGPTAIVRTSTGLTIQITTHRTAPWSIGQLAHCDLEPSQFQIIVAKGVNAPLAAYEAVCPNFIRVDTPGTTAANMEKLEYHRRRRPMYPFERDCPYFVKSSTVEHDDPLGVDDLGRDDRR
ncbi:MAG: M81 family metallopeptidase [Pirellulaceae bacterium]